eukprot:PhF_6_TR16568/c0_g1_i1/m.25254/K10732/GINS1, PSF1; GINS complex subunit 1
MIDDNCCHRLVTRARTLQKSGPSDFNAFDETNVTAAVRCVRTLWDIHERDLGNPFIQTADPYYAGKLDAVKSQLLHDKRCLCCYLKTRLDVITSNWWSSTTTTSAAVSEFSTPAEAQFEKDYSSLLVVYMAAMDGLDLRVSGDGKPPPEVKRFVDVQGLREYVYVSPQTGRTVQVYPGKGMSLLYEDVVSLAALGVIERL